MAETQQGEGKSGSRRRRIRWSPWPKAPMESAMSDLPFWKTKTLAEMTEGEWESLCDGSARACRVKLESEDTAKIFHLDIGCALLDGRACRCRDYPNRSARVDDC